MSEIREVALLGADGTLGPHVLHGLISHGFNVTVLKRASSKSKDDYPAGVKVEKVPDDFDIDAVAKVVNGKDAVVVTIKGSNTEIQDKLAQACIKGGVKRFIPADFGSCDSSSEWAQYLIPLYKHKTELRERLTKLANENEGFTWTSLVPGHFFDWTPEFLHINVEERKADMLDDGEKKFSTSSMSRIGEATAAILKRLESTKNRVLFVQSFCVTQNEVIKSYEKATGSKWEIQKFDSKQYEKEEKAKADGGDSEAVENLVWLAGTLDTNWEGQDNFAMHLLGLENEDLDTVVQSVVDRQK